LNDLVTATGGKTFPLASDGSNISSALDDVNDFVLENAEDKRPTQMLVGPDSSDVIQAELPINLTLNALGLQFSSSDIKTNTSANTAISQIDEAFQHIFKESSLLGATYNQLESSLAQNLNLKINTQEFLSSVEDVNYAMEVSTSVGMSLRARSSTEMLQKWFRIQSETLQSLLD
jgi:flagellin-like hook-associated protein FlgL